MNYTNLLLTDNQTYSVELFSMSGELKEKLEVNSQKYQFNVENYEPGVYLIRVSKTNGSESDVIRFVKE